MLGAIRTGSAVDWDRLNLAFWHPFGPYCGLSEEAILRWKSKEVDTHRWTFWSFAYAPTASKWTSVLREHSAPIHILCSYSPKAKDPCPNEESRRATHYRFLNESNDWRPMSSIEGHMFVTNRFKRRGRATAFKITRVELVHPPSPLLWRSNGSREARNNGPVVSYRPEASF